jgi:hypothetical protein
VKYREVTHAGLSDDVVGADAFTHHQQRISLPELCGQRRAQRSSGKYASVTDAAPPVDYAKREILCQRRILQSIIHDDEAGALRVRKRCTGDAIPCDDGRRHTRDQKRLVANFGGNGCMSIHKHWTCDIPAIAAAETDGTLASVREHSCEHHDRWRLTRAAKREIAHA